MAIQAPPSYARVRRIIDALDGAVVQLWGWPGTGKRPFLERLLVEKGVAFLSRRAMKDGRDLEARLDSLRQEGERWFVSELPSLADVRRVASLLAPGERLLFATERRLPLGGSTYVTSPLDWLLTREEIAALWSELTGR